MRGEIRTLVAKPFLLLPVRTGAPKVRAVLRGSERQVAMFEIELAPLDPDFHVFVDVAQHRGETLTLELESDEPPPDLSGALAQSDHVDTPGRLYSEPLRPQFHFSSRRGWNNDPNGLVYHEGTYHMFYQHNPYGWGWGNIHWGHAVSLDLVHWKELPDALAPDEFGTVWSGSGLVDRGNTSGLGTSTNEPLVLVYTSAGNTSPWSKDRPVTQALACSTDSGASWSRFAGNPVVPHIAAKNRDPKVIWHPPSGQWVMVLYLEKGNYAFLGSRDLKSWEQLSTMQIPGSSECPDFYPLPVDGDSSTVKWILSAADGGYFIGGFDGRTFTPETGVQRFSFGAAYAAQTWSDIPIRDGRRIQIAWLKGDKPGMPFNQQMSFPIEISLRRTPSGLRLYGRPAREIESLVADKSRRADIALDKGQELIPAASGELLDVEVRMSVGALAALEIKAHGIPLSFADGVLSLGQTRAPLPLEGQEVRLRVLVDRSSVEVFAQGGLVYLSAAALPPKGSRPLSMVALGPGARVESLVVRQLRSIWA